MAFGLDAKTRRVHDHSDLDIIAIRVFCCDTYYACKQCHAESADHSIRVWRVALWNQNAILCGNCRIALSIPGLRARGISVQSVMPALTPAAANSLNLFDAKG